MASQSCNHGHIIPTPNTQVLAESLANGQISVSSALEQVNHLVTETLRIIGEFANERAKLYSRAKVKMDEMEQIIDNLSGKCQELHQTLLFKEEQYDEKCREAERYKSVCEIAAKATADAVHLDVNNNLASGQDRKDNIVKFESSCAHKPAASPNPSQRNVIRHLKFTKPVRAERINPPDFTLERLKSLNPRNEIDELSLVGEREPMAQHYIGGHSKLKLSAPHNSQSHGSRSIQDKFEMIGGVNVGSPHVNTGPVPLNRLVARQRDNSHDDNEPSKRVRIDVTGQRNEILSSSGSNALRIRQMTVDRDLHRQVSGGAWTRLASRRKKDWPF